MSKKNQDKTNEYLLCCLFNHFDLYMKASDDLPLEVHLFNKYILFDSNNINQAFESLSDIKDLDILSQKYM